MGFLWGKYRDGMRLPGLSEARRRQGPQGHLRGIRGVKHHAIIPTVFRHTREHVTHAYGVQSYADVSLKRAISYIRTESVVSSGTKCTMDLRSGTQALRLILANCFIGNTFQGNRRAAKGRLTRASTTK